MKYISLLERIAGCCTLTHIADGSGPWTIDVAADGQVELSWSDETGQEHMLQWTGEEAPPVAHYVGQHMPGLLRIDGVDYRITWTKFAGLYKDVTERVHANLR